ncbi:hypothetical protein M413DRAFT_25585 [Hebeloma cylindrosporum]|uniref:Uncharacterized protein n=1 Tax=Hebeloma cylindrosporum TaxID=76867 RepID=A0A0C2Y2T1_HEBCY|nr:hypothetical protein M413DRAFT_25585 [Hebeloma cylindrosporum h7]
MDDPSTHRLADHLGSLYIAGNPNCDSFDVGLSSLCESPSTPIQIKRPSSPPVRSQLRQEKGARYNDLIVLQLSINEREILRLIGVPYITKLLNPPINLDANSLRWVDYALCKLSSKQRRAATALLPILRSFKDGPSGHNALQLRSPSTEDAVCCVEESEALDINTKSTLDASLRGGLATVDGNDLFLCSSGGETQVETLEREIRGLETQITGLR